MKKILWICDEMKLINHHLDTTMRLIEESHLLGNHNYYSDASKIEIINTTVELNILFVRNIQRNNNCPYSLSLVKINKKIKNDYDFIFFRCDLPFDATYIMKLQLLKFYLNTNPSLKIINSLENLLFLNSKILTQNFKVNTPKSIFSNNLNSIYKFCESFKEVVIKEINSGASKGIHFCEVKNELKIANLTQKLTNDYRTPIQVQEYIKLSNEHELRIWFLNGEILCSAFKVKSNFKKEKRHIFDSENGDYLKKNNSNISRNNVVPKLKAFIKKNQISFCAIDLLNDKIIDFNIASPGLIVEVENLYSCNFAKKIILKL